MQPRSEFSILSPRLRPLTRLTGQTMNRSLPTRSAARTASLIAPPICPIATQPPPKPTSRRRCHQARRVSALLSEPKALSICDNFAFQSPPNRCRPCRRSAMRSPSSWLVPRRPLASSPLNARRSLPGLSALQAPHRRQARLLFSRPLPATFTCLSVPICCVIAVCACSRLASRPAPKSSLPACGEFLVFL